MATRAMNLEKKEGYHASRLGLCANDRSRENRVSDRSSS
jgi:hypothetical protein